MENARLLLPLPYATGGIDAQGGGEPHAEYPDIDLRVNGQGYVRKNGTPYSWLPAGSASPDTVLVGFERAFARGERNLALLKALKGAIMAQNRWNPTYVG